MEPLLAGCEHRGRHLVMEGVTGSKWLRREHHHAGGLRHFWISLMMEVMAIKPHFISSIIRPRHIQRNHHIVLAVRAHLGRRVLLMDMVVHVLLEVSSTEVDKAVLPHCSWAMWMDHHRVCLHHLRREMLAVKLRVKSHESWLIHACRIKRRRPLSKKAITSIRLESIRLLLLFLQLAAFAHPLSMLILDLCSLLFDWLFPFL